MFPLLRVIIWQVHHWDAALSYLLFLQPREGGSAGDSSWLSAADRLMQGAARNDEWLWFVASVLLYAKARGANPGRARQIAAWCITLALSSLVVVVLKRVVRRPRPAWTSDEIPGGTPAKMIDSCGRFGFPSGYAARLAASCFWLPRIYGNGAKVLWFAAPLLLFARVRMGAGYVNDVLGGVAVGGALAWIVGRVARVARGRGS